jgi:hypothetical protein
MNCGNCMMDHAEIVALVKDRCPKCGADYRRVVDMCSDPLCGCTATHSFLGPHRLRRYACAGHVEQIRAAAARVCADGGLDLDSFLAPLQLKELS